MRFRILFSLFFVSISLKAQVSVSTFLISAYQDNDLKSTEEQLRYLDTRPYQLSSVRNLEFRTRSNQLDPGRQDYALRLNPANPWEIRSTARYYEAYASTLKSKRELALKQALIDRYKLVIQWVYYQDLLSLKQKAIRLTEAQVSILDGQQTTDLFKGDDFVSLKLDNMEHWTEEEEISYDLMTFRGYINGKCPGAAGQPIDWQNESFVSMDRIEQIMDSLSQQEIPSAMVLYRERQINLADEEYTLEKTNINVGYLQAQYESYRIEQDRKPWNLSLGITIPIANPNKGDMTKRRLEAIDARQELEQTRTELATEKKLAREKLQSLLTRYRKVEEKLEGFKTGTLANTLSTLDEGNPIAIIRYDRNLVKIETILVKLKQSILSSYVEFVAIYDRLYQRPLINYLSENLHPIE
jgi:hypothetical protein